MIEVLERYDSKTAAGVLARAALALESADSNPAGTPTVAGEDELRHVLLREVRDRLGIERGDERPETVERVCDALDEEADRLIGETDDDQALLRLAERGELPSDRFEVRIIPQIADIYGPHFAEEKRRIEETVRAPLKEQNFGPPVNPEDPFLISLYARFYPNKYPHRGFYMLVAGMRNKLVLDIHQAWRVYPSRVTFRASSDLVEVLRRFSEVYGDEFEAGGQRGKFVLSTSVGKDVGETTVVKLLKPGTHTTSVFWQNDPQRGIRRASLITCINLDRYRETLETMGW